MCSFFQEFFGLGVQSCFVICRISSFTDPKLCSLMLPVQKCVAEDLQACRSQPGGLDFSIGLVAFSRSFYSVFWWRVNGRVDRFFVFRVSIFLSLCWLFSNFAVPRVNLVFLFCSPNLSILCYPFGVRFFECFRLVQVSILFRGFYFPFTFLNKPVKAL